LLDMALGGHPDVRGVGELINAVRNGWLQNEPCSCGRPANDCPFWSQVRRAWAERSTNDLERYVALQDAFESYGRAPRLLRERRSEPSPEFREYAASTRALFEAIREVGGEPVVVDSSKNPARALALWMTPGVELSLVHLVRDGRGVAASLNRSWRRGEEAGVTRDVEGRPVWKTAASWISTNLFSDWVRRRLPPDKSIRIRYEDLVAAPKETLGGIGRLVDVDLSPVAENLASGGTVAAEHSIAGNRLRMSKEVRLRPDAGSWKSILSHGQKRLSWALMGWLLRRYGYKR
jgi:hypothetical protein